MFDSPLFCSISVIWLHTLRGYYSRPDRHYHTIKHVDHLLDLFRKHVSHLEDPASVELAIYFHDAYYDPTSTEVGHNERRSVELFKEYSLVQSLDSTQIAKVEALILATVHHAIPDSREAPGVVYGDMTFFLDIDMAILASDSDDYDGYAENIRKEYGHYDDSSYRKGRKSVLQRFVEKDRIYLSPIFEGGGMEKKARGNIKREIARLGD